MKSAIIIPNTNKDSGLSVTRAVISRLDELGITPFVDEALGLEAPAVGYADIPKEAELIIVIGGDGSIIDASVVAVECDLPILGINLGRVGYLSELEPDELIQLERLKSGEYRIDERMLLTVCALDRDGTKRRISERYAVNDLVFSHESYLGIADFTLEDSAGNTIKYRADGIIFSTPQGSTAYSLSAGGPILAHDVEGIVATPVCPHSFFNRSVIFNPEEKIKVTNNASDALNVSVDGRLALPLEIGESCYISRAQKSLKILSLTSNRMFSSLFKKMKIMGDI